MSSWWDEMAGICEHVIQKMVIKEYLLEIFPSLPQGEPPWKFPIQPQSSGSLPIDEGSM